MAGTIGKTLPGVEIQHCAGGPGERTRLIVKRDGIGVKVETSTVLRGTVGRPAVRGVCPTIEAQFQPLEKVFETQFKGMTLQPVGVAELEETRHVLVKIIRERLTDVQRRFLLSFKKGMPEW